MAEHGTLRIAAVGDLHCGADCEGDLQSLFASAAEHADVLLLLGDLTKYGRPEEARALARELSAAAKLPKIAVLGNHDYESDMEGEICSILKDADVRLLDGTTTEIRGVAFTGVKGFCGGFGRRSLEPWGEAAIKNFVREGVEESLKLESALARLRNERKVVLLHYAPIYQTIVGEPEQIAPFLGSTRLEEPLDRYRVSVVFHGHAHHGSPEGKTKTGIPVFNVAMPLLKRLDSKRPPYLLYELPAKPAEEDREPQEMAEPITRR